MAAHQAPPSLGFSRQEHWSGLLFPSPMRESEVTQSCLTLCDPMDCSPPGSSVPGIFQARVLEWGAVAFSRDAADVASIRGLERSPAGGDGNPVQYSCLENPMDRGAWWAAVHGVAQSQTRLTRLSSSSRVYLL